MYKFHGVKMLPNKVTEKMLKTILRRTATMLGIELELRHNMYRRLAVFKVNGPMLTPGYLSNRELYTWLNGVWLQSDKKELFNGKSD